MFRTTFLLVLLCAVMAIAFPDCQKEIKTEYVLPDSTYTGSIQFVLQYNPTQFGIFYNILQIHELADSLSAPGPFTVFAPSNEWVIYTPDIPTVANYIVPKSFPLGQLKPGDAVPVYGKGNYKIWVNAYSFNSKMRYTANGVLITQADQQATNGTINTTAGQLPATVYPSCKACLDGNPSFSTFAYAVRRSGLETLLSDSTAAYSVLVPTNDVFAAAGIDIDSIGRMDVDSVAAMVKFHIMKGRYYSYDFEVRYQGDGTNPDTLSFPTLADSSMKVGIVTNGSTDPKDFYFQFTGSDGSTSYQGLYQTPFPSGAGVVRNIDHILKP